MPACVVAGLAPRKTAPVVDDGLDPSTELDTNNAETAGEAVAWGIGWVANPPLATVPVQYADLGQQATWPTASIAQNALSTQQ